MTMTKERVLIIGAGLHARVILDILRHDTTKEIVGFLDKNRERDDVCGVPILGDDYLLENPEFRGTFDSAIIGLGGDLMEARSTLYKKIKNLRLKMTKAIHPSATVSDSAEVGEGTVIMAGAIINPGACIQENCVVNTGAIVDHDSIVEHGVFIQPGAILAGNVHVGERSIIGMGARVLDKRRIGENSIVGAGSVVTKDVPSNTVVMGIPARKHRDNEVRQ